MKNNLRTRSSHQRRLGALTGAIALCAAVGWAAPLSAQPAAEYGAVGGSTKAAATGAATMATKSGQAVAATAAAPTAAPRADKAAPKKAAAAAPATGAAPVTAGPVCVGEFPPPVTISLVAGKSTLIKLPGPITLRTLGDDEVVQARMLSPDALYLLGLAAGGTNMMLQDAAGRCTLVDVSVGMDSAGLQAKLAQLLPGEKGIQVTSAVDTVVLTGTVSDAVKVEQAVTLANAYVRGTLDKGRLVGGSGGGGGGGDGAMGRQSARVVNMLAVDSPQQVLLEVKVAEVSKALLDKLGASVNLQRISGGWAYTILADFLSGGAGIIDAFKKATGEFLTIDGENKDGLVKILAEPNLMAISGQEGSFLAGGKVFFPVAQGSTSGGIFGVNGTVPITLYEQEFGVGLKFTPTVLAGGRINLKVTPEVSELAPEGVAIQAVNIGGRTIAPLITTRRASTTVQLYDGQSFAIGGLIKSNVRTDIKAFPILGEIPIIGALFRSTSFQTDKSELLFVVTPHLVKPMVGNVQLPTDSYIEPTRLDLFLGGRMEGTAPEPPTAGQVPPKAPTGFETK